MNNRKITKTLLIAFIFSGIYFNSFSQSASSVLDSLLNRKLDSMLVVVGNKSLSAAIEMPNGYKWSYATGVSSVNPTVNVDTTNVYLIGSVTKTLIAACILQLADSNVLHLDDSLYQWVDTIQYIDPNITIRQLLRHQSGIYDVLQNPQCQPDLLADEDSIWLAEDLINTYILAPYFQPGNGWRYSNTNYFLLGMIIKAATGNEFYTELRNRFFTPLQLSSFAIPSFETMSSPVAHVWMDLNGDGIYLDEHNFYTGWLSLNAAGGAAGGYYSTASDLSKWMRTYMRGDLVSSSLMQEAMTTVTAPGNIQNYGLGLMRRSFLGLTAYGHGGDLAYSANSWYFPARDISISVLNNDASIISWDLIPVITALLQEYNNWYLTNGVIDQNKNNFSAKVFPNPFDNSLNISLTVSPNTKQVKYQLIDMLGKIVYENEESIHPSGSGSISINDLEKVGKGCYYLNLITDDKLFTTVKVVKL